MTELATQEVARARAAQIRAGIQNYLHTLANVAAAYQQRDWKALGYPSWDSYVDGEYGADRLKLSAEHRQKAVAELRLAGMSQRAIGSALGVDAATVNRDLRGVASATPDEIQGADGKTYASTRPTSAAEVDGSTASADGADDDDAPLETASAGAPDVHAAPARPGPVEGSPGPGRVTPTDATGPGLVPVEATETAGSRVADPAASPGEVDAAGSPDPRKPNRRPLPDAAASAGWELDKAVGRIARLVDDDRYPRNAEQVAAHLRGHLQRALLTLSEVSERLPKSQLEVTP